MNALEIRGLTKRRGDFALQGLDLTLPAGCIMGLIGENGAGKSTTIRLILNALSRDGGTVAVYGKDNRALTPLEREDIGAVLDEATSGLDPVVRDEILTIFADFTRDEEHAVLISSHIVSDLEKICDYIAFLHKGRLLLCEEKDRLTEEYGILRGGTDGIAPAAVCGRHATPYGTEYLVRRDAVPVGMALGQVNIEDLFVFMAKEA